MINVLTRMRLMPASGAVEKAGSASAPLRRMVSRMAAVLVATHMHAACSDAPPGAPQAVAPPATSSIAKAAAPVADPKPATAERLPERPAELKGAFRRHKFTATTLEGTTIALFAPFLPRNDATFFAAASAVTSLVHGTSLVPSTATPLAGKILVAAADGRRFLLFPIKQDTGEIHSISITPQQPR